MVAASLPSLSNATSIPEQLRPVSQVAEELTGCRPSPSTIWRWVRKGVVGGVKLSATRYLGKWHCKLTDFQRFLERETAAVLEADTDDRPVGSSAPPANEVELRAAGLL